MRQRLRWLKRISGVMVVTMSLGTPPVGAEVSAIELDITIQEGESSIMLLDRDQNPLRDALEMEPVFPTPVRTRFAFGEVWVDFFAAGAFNLITYTDDGDSTTSILGIPGQSDASKRLALKTWTPDYGTPVTVDQLPLIKPLGPVSPNARVPHPQIDSLWKGDDPDGPADGLGEGERLGAVWKRVAERNSVIEDGTEPFLTVLISSGSKAPGRLGVGLMDNTLTQTRFPVYFAFDTSTTSPQTYRGELMFEIRNK